MSTEAMQQALEALKESIDVPCYGGHPKQEAAYHALQEAIANEALDRMAENARELGLDYEPAQQEPVAWRVKWPAIGGGYRWMMVDRPLMEKQGFVNEALYTSPPTQRTWVGLTGDEIVNMLPDDDTPMSLGEAFFKFAELIEAKLKEKNT